MRFMGKKKGENKTELISFKVSTEIFEEVKTYAKSQTDEAGLPLSVSLAARRLMLRALNKKKE